MNWTSNIRSYLSLSLLAQSAWFDSGFRPYVSELDPTWEDWTAKSIFDRLAIVISWKLLSGRTADATMTSVVPGIHNFHEALISPMGRLMRLFAYRRR